jgi:hypothetical protein
MSSAKQAPKRRRRAKAVSVLGAAGLLSLAGGASAATSGAPVADLPTQKTAPNHEIIVGEEELSDVSLATFYVFDKENAPIHGIRLALVSINIGHGNRGCGHGNRGCGHGAWGHSGCGHGGCGHANRACGHSGCGHGGCRHGGCGGFSINLGR